jgi:uncharacterized protein YjbI with pentapeptide repeats
MYHDFSGKNLRGRNFKGQNLTHSNFSYADIRGANFTNANLKSANFSHVTAGFQAHQLLYALTATSITGFLVGLISYIIGFSINSFLGLQSIQYLSYIGMFFGVILLTIFLPIFRNAYLEIKETRTRSALSWYSSMISLCLSFLLLCFIVALTVSSYLPLFLSKVLFVASVIFLSLSLACSVSFGVTIVIGYIGVMVLMGSFIETIAFHINFLRISLLIFAFLFLLYIYISFQSLLGNRKYAWFQPFIWHSPFFGCTSFRAANLTDTNFSKAKLGHTDFAKAKLTNACFFQAQGTEYASFRYSLLKDKRIRDLVVTGDGHKKTYIGLTFWGLNLSGVNLSYADLKRVDISGANLRKANLEWANLKEVQAIGADFTGASLTGACLEAWNVDHTTKLSEVECQFVFLLDKPDALGNRERRPYDPNTVFAPGDFEKLYTKIMHTVQFLLRNGINRQAFAEAFQNLMRENPDISYDSFQAIEKKGNDVLLTLTVPENADKAKIYQDFIQTYYARIRQLEAQTEQLQLHAGDLKEIVLILAGKPQTIVNEASINTMQETNRKIEIGSIGGDFNASGQALNLGEMDISGQVTNMIKQLPDESISTEQLGIKELLTQLQKVINEEIELSNEDKADLLEQVKTLAQANQTPEQQTKEGLVRKARKIFEATLKGLPDTAKIVEACSKLLPLILKALGQAP